ncbi:SusC/RagA family TonB-linked outer membrane protein [Candidatus Ulvibacter alkanivorans]|uniref:SusC/RagA family TonB-linked outer membrane protein n=1 Tax=Candidatus Ulvibacter alkanivorans TaxID=2267620 RepID=UPI000DF46290|nr:SusC/RagA family TonB-linked outer membrane protein [Candidatus Ulvibacter alkanivorans]
MKTKLCRIISVFLLLATQIVLAQEKTISGTVTDNNGLPLPGVNIIVKNTTNGTQSDFDGNYSIVASVGETLVFSYVGFTSQEVPVTQNTNTINISLDESAAELDEVLVTALGIKKEKKALGYAVTALDAEDLEQRATGDITKILRGKAAGVDVINASGLSGAGSSIVIRGLSTTGDNQPLYVVDGVRFNSNTNGTGLSGTSRSLDIDPNNIASVNVLRGLNATTLYGADGKNGVIVITTKAGQLGGNFNKKNEVSVTVSTFINEIASLPDFTDERGQGYYDAYYNFFGNWGATFGRPNYGNIDAQGQTSHPYALNSPVFVDGFPDQEDARVDYRNYKSQENFFETGLVKNINVSVNGGTENVGYNLSFSNLDDEGFLPGNKLDRNAIALGGNAKLSNNFSVSSTLNYVNTKFTSPFTGPIFTGLLNTPRSIDLAGFPSQHPLTGEEINFQNDAGASNPYWFVNNSGINEEVNRAFGQISTTYNFSDNFTATYRYGIDVSIEQRKVFVNRGSTGGANVDGALTTSTRRQTVTNHTLLLNYENRFADDMFGIQANIGGDVSRNEETFDGANSSEQTVFGQFNHDFFTASQGFNSQFAINRPGIFAQATFDIDNFLYITGNARNDWTSNFIDNSQFYPGVGVSFLPTAAFEGLKGDALTYLKLRAGYGSSAEFSVPGSIYPTSQTINSNPNSFVTANGDVIAIDAIDNSLANQEIGPSLVEEIEFGIESKFFNNRVTLDASYYTRTTTDLIFNTNFDPATGFTNGPQNINEFESDGIELNLNVKVFDTENFGWDIGGNFTKTDSEVTELDVDQFQFAGSGELGNYLIKGQPVGIILGSIVQRDENGNLLNNGREYAVDPEIAIIGDPTPDWVASFFTAMNYKNLSLTANLQYRQGGDIYSSTARSLLGRGLTTDTDGLQNAGFILPGINTDTNMENDVVISTGDAYFNLYNNGPDEFGIFDGTTIRLQEVALTYRFSDKALDRTPFGNMSISLVGENLYFKAINIPDGLNVDTNSIGTGVNSNGAGIELGVSPSSRRVGVSIKASF